MKKFTLLLLSALFCNGIANADAGDVIYSSTLTTVEEFNEWSFIDNNKDETTWIFDDYNLNAKYGYHADNSADDWLISPAIEVPAGIYILQFEYRGSSYGEMMDVWYGSGAELNDLTNQLLDLGLMTNGDDWATGTKMFAIDSSQTIHLAFHAKSDPNKFKIYLRNVVLTQANGLDMQAQSITTIDDGLEMGLEDITFKVKNNGVQNVSNLKVSYQINDNEPIEEIITDEIAAGAEYDYTFATKADFTATGAYTITATTLLEGDEITSNDAVTHIVRHKGPANVPYTQGFETTDNTLDIVYFDLNEDEADDKNGDWDLNLNSFFSYFSRTGDYCMMYTYSKTHPGDDWFILEPINLKAGKYSLKFWYSSDHNESLEVCLGTEATPQAMTTQIVSIEDFNEPKYVESASVIDIETDGIYYFGWHATSEPDQNMIVIDDISIDEITILTADLTIKDVLSPTNGYVREQSNQNVEFSVTNNSTIDVETTTIETSIDDIVIDTRTFDVKAQSTKNIVLENALASLEPGNHTIKITAALEGDETPEDNVYESTFVVVGTPKVLYDFENGIPEDFTLLTEDNGIVRQQLADIFPNNEAWALIEISEHQTLGKWMLAAASWLNDGVAADRWAILPKMEVKDNNAHFIWTACSADGGFTYKEDYKIMISEKGLEPTDFVEVMHIEGEEFATDPATRGISLSEYKGKEIYVAIRLVTEDGYFLTVDNLGFYGDMGIVSSVNKINIDENNAPIEYYNLQGIRIINPEAEGIYIKRQGNKITKVVR